MTSPDDLYSTDEIARERARKRLGDMGDVLARPPVEVSRTQMVLDQLAEYDRARGDAKLMRDIARAKGGDH